MPLPKFVVTAALMAAQMAMSALRKIEGPRLEDLKVTVGDPGAPLNYFFGTRRFAGIPIFYAEDIREKKKRRKTKGGKFKEYTYYGTFAAVIADHEIDGVTRIWLDKHLVYDVTSGGPISVIGSGDSILSYLRIYLGTDSQEADPRMLAKIEALHGVGSCPAYRRIAYLMFEELPLEHFGNRIPQISVEAVANGVPALPYDAEDTTGSSGYRFMISPTGQWMVFHNQNGDIEWWDLPTRTRLGFSEDGGAAFSPIDSIGLADDGTAYYMGARIVGVDLVPNFYTTTPMGVTVRGPDLDEDTGFGQITRAFGSGGTTEVYSNRDAPGYFYFGTYFNHEWCLRDCFKDQAGDVWGIFQPDGASDSFGLMNFDDGAFYTFTASTSRGDVSAARGCATAYNTYWITMDNRWYAIDQDTMTIASSGIGATSADVYPFNRPGQRSFWNNTTEISLEDGATIRTVSGWAHGQAAHVYVYDPVSHAVVMRPQFVSTLFWQYLDRITGAGVTLASINATIFDRCGIEAADYSVTAFSTITIDGWSYTQGQGSSILEPLNDLHGALLRPHNFQVQGLLRGGASAGTIDVAEFARDGSGPRYTVRPLLDTDMPRYIELTFLDPAADQQPNMVPARRPLPTVDGVGVQSYDMTTWVSVADTARNLLETYMRGIWNRNEIIENGLTAQRLALEPGDMWNLGLDGETRTATITKMTISADDRIKLEWEKDFAQLATLPDLTAQPRDGHAPNVVFIPITSKALVLDIPLIRDGDNDSNPLLYAGAAPIAPGVWPGAIIYQHDGTDYDTEFASIASTFDATWGQASTTLADATHYVWDRGNSFTVTLNNGELAAATEAQCNANPRLNMFALGGPGRWEIGQFTTPALVSGTTYTVSGLLRGRRGTEWATGLHTSSDMFVLLDMMAPVEMGAGDIGDELLFKAQTNGLDLDSALITEIDPYEAMSNKPWAPDSLWAGKDPSTGDWNIVWHRRSRVAGDWAPDEPPLGESVESYNVKIYRSGFGSAATRTITVGTNAAVYEAADQITDGGDVAVGDLDFGVLQVGDLADGLEKQASF